MTGPVDDTDAHTQSSTATEHALMRRECIDCGGTIDVDSPGDDDTFLRYRYSCPDCGLTGRGTLR